MISLLQKFLPFSDLAFSTRILFHIEFYYLQMGQKQKRKEITRARERGWEMLSTLSLSLCVCVCWRKFPFIQIFSCLVFSLCHFSSLFVFVFQPTHTHTFHLRWCWKVFFLFYLLLWAFTPGWRYMPHWNFHRADASFSTHLSFSYTFFTVNTG